MSNMSYNQVRDILNRAQALRRHVEAFCEECQASSDDELLQEMLARIRDRENYMRKCLDAFEDDTAEGILSTWIQYSGLDALDEAITALREADPADDEPRAVLPLILNAERALIEGLELAAAQTTAPRVQDYFEKLLNMEDQTSRAIGKDVVDMEDLEDIRRN